MGNFNGGEIETEKQNSATKNKYIPRLRSFTSIKKNTCFMLVSFMLEKLSWGAQTKLTSSLETSTNTEDTRHTLNI